MGAEDAREPEEVDVERKTFGKRLLRAEKLARAGKSLKITAPKWAAAEVAECIPYFRFYAENGTIPNGTTNPLFYIRPEDIAYDVWQAAVGFKGRISKRDGAGNKALRLADDLTTEAKIIEAKFLATTLEIQSAIATKHYSKEFALSREMIAIQEIKASSMKLAARAADALDEMIRSWASSVLPRPESRSKYRKIAPEVHLLLEKGLSRSEAIRQLQPAGITTAKQEETFRKGIERALARQAKIRE